MTTNLARTLMGVGLAAVLTVGAGTAAYAGPSAPPKPPKGAGVAAWQHAVDVRIDLRLATLKGLTVAVGAATDLTSADKATLGALVAADTTGLGTLRTKTDGETTVAAVRADGRTMIVDYRIYLLVVKKVRLTIAADTETTVIARLHTVHDKLAKVAAQLAAKGKDTGQVTTQLADLSTQLTSATTALDGQVATLLAVTPSPDAAAMLAATAKARTAVHGARNDIRAAIADAKLARTELKKLAA